MIKNEETNRNVARKVGDNPKLDFFPMNGVVGFEIDGFGGNNRIPDRLAHIF